jgi:hypothetical protein
VYATFTVPPRYETSADTFHSSRQAWLFKV